MARARIAAVAALVLVLLLGATAAAAPGAVRPTGVTAQAAVAWPPSSGLLVAEVVTGGASASDEYVELTNASATAVDLAGLEVAYVTSSGSTVTRKASWSTPLALEPGRHLLVANASGIYAASADATYSGGFAATGGAIVVRPIGGQPLDAVAWGDATNAFVEGIAAPAPAAGSSIERRPGGPLGNSVDTNDNAADFVVNAAPVCPGPGGRTDSLRRARRRRRVHRPALRRRRASRHRHRPTATAELRRRLRRRLRRQPRHRPRRRRRRRARLRPRRPLRPRPRPRSPPRRQRQRHAHSDAVPVADRRPSPTVGPTPTAAPQPLAGALGSPSPSAAPSASPSASPPITIAAARLSPIGTTVFVRGVVVAEAGRLGTPPLLAIADATGGIPVRLPDGVAPPARGTLLEVRGALADPYGQVELRPPSGGIAVVGTGTLTLGDRPERRRRRRAERGPPRPRQRHRRRLGVQVDQQRPHLLHHRVGRCDAPDPRRRIGGARCRPVPEGGPGQPDRHRRAAGVAQGRARRLPAVAAGSWRRRDHLPARADAIGDAPRRPDAEAERRRLETPAHVRARRARARRPAGDRRGHRSRSARACSTPAAAGRSSRTTPPRSRSTSPPRTPRCGSGHESG